MQLHSRMMANDKYTEPKRKCQVWRLWKERDDFQPRRILKYLGLSETSTGAWKVSRIWTYNSGAIGTLLKLKKKSIMKGMI